MKQMNRWLRKAGICFAVTLAVSLIAGCESSNEQSAATSVTPAVSPVGTPAQSAAPAAAAEATAPPTIPVMNVTPPARIKAGVSEKITDSAGNVWLPDEGYSNGNAYEAPDAEISNTKDPALYRTERFSMDGYSFAVPNGNYTVKLHFAEIYSGIEGPGGRVFSFNVQDREFNDFDIYAKAGGPNKAYIQPVDVEVTNGKLNITFTPNVENPKISAIEILPRS